MASDEGRRNQRNSAASITFERWNVDRCSSDSSAPVASVADHSVGSREWDVDQELLRALAPLRDRVIRLDVG